MKFMIKAPTYELIGGRDGLGQVKMGAYYDDLASLERAIVNVLNESPKDISEIYFTPICHEDPYGYGFFGIQYSDPTTKRPKK